MLGFIKMNNSIFDYKLSAKSFFVYAYLLCKSNCLRSVTIPYAAIAQGCRIDPKTAQAAVRELTDSGLLYRTNRFNSRGYLANQYSFSEFSRAKAGWFKLDCELFQTEIRPTDFVVFAYLQKCMDSRRKEAFPSLSAISKDTRISRGRVAQAIAYLRSHTFMNRIRRHYRRTRAYRHNRYLRFQCGLVSATFGGKEKARTPKGPDQISQHIYSTPHFGKSQALFSFLFRLRRWGAMLRRGWYAFSQTVFRRTSYNLKERR